MTNQQKILGAVCGLACCAGVLFYTWNYKKEPETVLVEVETMRPSSIYEPDAIFWYSKRHNNDNAEMAVSYLKKAKELEEQNLPKAIYNARRAITLQPTAEHYRYLAKLLNTAGQYKELEQVYGLLAMQQDVDTDGLVDNYEGDKQIYLFGEPDEDTFYEFLAAGFLANNYLQGGFVYLAENMGFSKSNLKKRFLADSRIKLVPGTEAYKEVMLQFLNEAEIEAYTQSEENFQNFLAAVKDSSQVFTIDEKEVQAFDYQFIEDYASDGTRYVSDFFIHYLEEKKQHPDNWYEFNVTRKVRLSDSVTAVVYAIDTSALGCPTNMRHIYHRLVTYNKKGGIIQSKIVALQNGEELATVHFSGNSFTVTEHKRTWKKPYHKAEFDNYLVKTVPFGSKNYQIGGDGKIQEQGLSASAEPAAVPGA